MNVFKSVSVRRCGLFFLGLNFPLYKEKRNSKDSGNGWEKKPTATIYMIIVYEFVNVYSFVVWKGTQMQGHKSALRYDFWSRSTLFYQSLGPIVSNVPVKHNWWFTVRQWKASQRGELCEVPWNGAFLDQKAPKDAIQYQI